MTIHLSNIREAFVRSLVQDGQFPTEDAVVEEALRLLQERFDEPAKLAELRQRIAIGIDQADRGELSPFDPQASLARIRSRRAAGTGQA